MNEHVLVLAKAPIVGQVKTRLCPPWSFDQAAVVAEAALADTLDAVAASGATRKILVLEGKPGPWLPEGFELIRQRGSSLNARLDAAWLDANGPGFQIGMDTPQVSAALIDRCLSAVCDHHETLFGPAVDGGWWALGLSGWTAGLFDGVSMSSASAGAQQLARLRQLGFSPSILPTLRDIDTVDDALIVAALIPRSRTARVVDEIVETAA